MKVIADGWVCTDRLLMMANGEIGDDETPERVEEVAKATAGWCYAGHDPSDMEREGDGEHCDREFSWNACRTCRNTLGGSRYFAVKLG